VAQAPCLLGVCQVFGCMERLQRVRPKQGSSFYFQSIAVNTAISMAAPPPRDITQVWHHGGTTIQSSSVLKLFFYAAEDCCLRQIPRNEKRHRIGRLNLAVFNPHALRAMQVHRKIAKTV